VAEQLPLLAEYASASIQGRVASGPRAGHPVRRLRSAAAMVDSAKPQCARVEGFSLHANVGVPAHARARLEYLCRFLLRSPLALERLRGAPVKHSFRMVGSKHRRHQPQPLRRRDL